MRLLNQLRRSYLIFSLLLSSSLYSVGSPIIKKDEKGGGASWIEQNCEEIDVKIQITHTSAGQPNGEILFVYPETNKEHYTLFIFSGDSKENRLEIKVNKVTELKKGEYNLYIQNSAGCTKHIKTRIN